MMNENEKNWMISKDVKEERQQTRRERERERERELAE